MAAKGFDDLGTTGNYGKRPEVSSVLVLNSNPSHHQNLPYIASHVTFLATADLASDLAGRDAATSPPPNQSLPQPYEIALQPGTHIFCTRASAGRTSDATYSLTGYLAAFFVNLEYNFCGLLHPYTLPSFPSCSRAAMAASHYPIPGTPRVTSPSPAPSETSSRDGYFGPLTRSFSRAARVTSPPVISEDDSSDSYPDTRRPRTRSRSRDNTRKRKIQPLTSGTSAASPTANGATNTKRRPDTKPPAEVNGYLSPPPRSYWRELSRSPSPLGLIPIHIQFRSFVRPPRLTNVAQATVTDKAARSTAMRSLGKSSTSPSAS